MNAYVALGIIGYLLAAVAFAAFWGRILHTGFAASIVAAACTASVILGFDYVATDQVNAHAVPLFAVFFVVSLIIAFVVQYLGRRHSSSETEMDVTTTAPSKYRPFVRVGIDLLLFFVYAVLLLGFGHALHQGNWIAAGVVIVGIYLALRARQYFAERFPNPKHGVEVESAVHK